MINTLFLNNKLNNDMRFSVLIPVIKKKFLKKSIDSVLGQDFGDFELIIYNDYSKDNIDEIVEKYDDNRIRYYKGKKNLGKEDPSKTWNKMLDMAKGDYIILLGDDDLLADNFLTEMDNLRLKYPDISLFRARMKRIDEKESVISSVDELPEFETWDKFLYERMINKREQSTSEFAIKRSELNKIGGYVNFPRACGSDDATYLKLINNSGVVSTNNTFAFWRKSDLNISDNDSDKLNEFKIKFILKWEQKFLDDKISLNVPASELYRSIYEYLNLWKNKRVEEQLTSTKEQLTSTKQQLTSTKEQLTSTKEQLTSTKEQLTSTKEQLIVAKSQIDAKNRQINNIYNSREYKVGLKVQRLFKIIFPVHSLRRKILVKMKNCLKKCKRLLKKNKTVLYVFIKSNYYKFKPKKKRQINKGAKKIVYIDHSYHNKTKSTIFLQEYLKKFFDVEVISDNSWRGDEYPDLSFINKEEYAGVIFFQLLPPKDILEKIDNDNIIFFPMYDQSGRLDFNYWDQYRNLKIVNFSNILYKNLKKWGFETMYIQYFPKVQDFTPGKKDEVFFWQRLTNININTVISLLKKQDIKIHLHKAIDPNHKFLQPTKEEEKKYDITYSTWFDTKEEMLDVIKQKGIYIAPREFEGIGQSFIEAMTMGKAVIAINNPTMNEYIKHNQTGYLFDLDNLQEIDLSSIAQVQENTYNYMVNGRRQWLKNRKKIIDFIKKV